MRPASQRIRTCASRWHARSSNGRRITASREDVLIDPLVMPMGAVGTRGGAFRLVRRCRDELGVNTGCGASNVSFGLPDRVTLNGAFLTMAIAAG